LKNPNAAPSMWNLHKYPFLRLLIPYAIGIWFAIQWPANFNDLLLWVLLGLGLLMMLTARFLIISYRFRWLFGFGLSLFLFVFGLVYTNSRAADSNPRHLLHAGQDYAFYLIRIADPPEARENTIKLIAELQAVGDGVSTKAMQAQMMVYVQRNPASEQLQYGDLIMFSKPPEVVPAPQNPYQFDYRKHLATKGIYHQVFLREKDWKIHGKGYANPVYVLAYKLRNYLLMSLHKNGIEGDEYAVASAILLGYDDHLPRHLRKGYAAAGAMHVLCVSGLHVGIIFILLNFLLGFLNKGRKARTIKTLLLLLSIWFYALLTGLSPSVNRASVMISFVLLAQLLNRKGNIINSLSASALMLLVANPYTLLHIGFQLSYTAVLGIVLFQKPIHNTLYIKNKYLDKAWEVTALSFAAQLGTTPLAVYYFNQFPVYFWLSNLFLVPLSFAVIVAGMSLLMISFVPFLSQLLGLATSGLLFVLNAIIHWIESLPLSTLQGLFLSPAEALLMYIFIGLVLLHINNTLRKTAIPGLFVLLLLVSSFSWRTIENNGAHKFIVYSIPNKAIYDFIHGREHILMADSSDMQNEFITGFNLEGNWTRHGLSRSPAYFGVDDKLQQHPFVYKNGMLLAFGPYKLALWRGRHACQSLTEGTYDVDVVIVGGNTRENLESLLQCYQFKQLVIDSSMPPWHHKAWTIALDNQHIPYYDVRQKGAFVWDLKKSEN
jgi:competence protein ComEC